MKFRRLNKMYAKAMGYFWLPCPLCGQYFGGHEWKTENGDAHSIPIEGRPNTRKGICPDCGYKREAEMNQKRIIACISPTMTNGFPLEQKAQQIQECKKNLQKLFDNIGGVCTLASDGSIRLPYLSAMQIPDFLYTLQFAFKIIQKYEKLEEDYNQYKSNMDKIIRGEL